MRTNRHFLDHFKQKKHVLFVERKGKLRMQEFVDDLAMTSMARLWDVGKSEPIKASRRAVLFTGWGFWRMRMASFQICSLWWFEILFIFNQDPWGNDPIWRAYFSKGFKPPTSVSSHLPGWHMALVSLKEMFFHLKKSRWPNLISLVGGYQPPSEIVAFSPSQKNRSPAELPGSLKTLMQLAGW